jgi:hypothetical protein
MSPRFTVNARRIVLEALLGYSAPGLVRQCAWCGRYGNKTGSRWIASRGQLALAPHRVTATICPDCWKHVAPKGTSYP